MRNDTTLQESISSKVLQLAGRFLRHEETNFVKLAQYLQLDPKVDFRDSDLTGVDLSNSNLAGYDFSGADLRGATGVGVTWDKTTSFDNAETEDSIFSHYLEHEKFRLENPDVVAEAERLVRGHWCNAILSVADSLNRKAGPNRSAVWIAKTVFNESRSLTVRSNVLYFMSQVSDNPEQHRAFIYDVLNRNRAEVAIVKSALRTLTALYARDLGAVNIMAAYLEHHDASVRNAALRGVLTSPYFLRSSDKILRYVISCNDSMLRRQYLGRIARGLGTEFSAAVTDPVTRNFIDFAAPITQRDLEKRAEAVERHKKYMTMIANAPRTGPNLEGSLKVDEKVIQDRVESYRHALERLKTQFKIPFVLVD